MRISDWSSDVCSSDLKCLTPCILWRRQGLRPLGTAANDRSRSFAKILRPSKKSKLTKVARFPLDPAFLNEFPLGRIQIGRAHAELQSLMRISYAVFCLKKKKTNTKSNSPPNYISHQTT